MPLLQNSSDASGSPPSNMIISESDENESVLEGIDLSGVHYQPDAAIKDDAASISGLEKMISRAEQEVQQYEEQSAVADTFGYIGGELGDMLNQYHIQAQYAEDVKSLKVPQFMLTTTPNLLALS